MQEGTKILRFTFLKKKKKQQLFLWHDPLVWHIVLHFSEKHHYWNYKETASWFCGSFSVLKIFRFLLGWFPSCNFSKKSCFLPLCPPSNSGHFVSPLFYWSPTKTAKRSPSHPFWNLLTFVALLAYLLCCCVVSRMGELNCHINDGKVHLKSFNGSKANQLNHHTIPILQEHQYDATAIHVGINDLLQGMPNNVTVDSICNDILEIALRCRNHNIGEVFFFKRCRQF